MFRFTPVIAMGHVIAITSKCMRNYISVSILQSRYNDLHGELPNFYTHINTFDICDLSSLWTVKKCSLFEVTLRKDYQKDNKSM